jgi:hypothetical protein
MLCDPHPPRSDVPNLGMGLEESAAIQPPANGAAARRSDGAGRGPQPPKCSRTAAERGGRMLWRRS